MNRKVYIVETKTKEIVQFQPNETSMHVCRVGGNIGLSNYCMVHVCKHAQVHKKLIAKSIADVLIRSS